MCGSNTKVITTLAGFPFFLTYGMQQNLVKRCFYSCPYRVIYIYISRRRAIFKTCVTNKDTYEVLHNP